MVVLEVFFFVVIVFGILKVVGVEVIFCFDECLCGLYFGVVVMFLVDGGLDVVLMLWVVY